MNDRNRTRLGRRDTRPGFPNRAAAAGLVTLMLCFAQARSAEDKITAIKGGVLYTVTSGIVTNGTILVKDGKIWQIGQGLEIPKDANVVDAGGRLGL